MDMDKIYHRDFYEPRNIVLSDIEKKFERVIFAKLSFGNVKSIYCFEIQSPNKPVDLDNNIIEWEDLGKKLYNETVSKIEIHKNINTALFSINFWQGNDILGIIRCKDINGLPE
jgi:hypothetical protein